MRETEGRHVALFDFDGTIADTKATITRCATQALLEFGLDEAEIGDVTRLIGPPFPEAFEMVYGLAPEDAERVTQRYRVIWDELGPAAAPIFDGMRELFEALIGAGWTLAVATSKQQSVIERCLALAGIDHLFAVVEGKPDDEPHTKAEAISGALARLGASPADAVMVGDRDLDVLGAAACGVPCVGVTWGGTGDVAELEGAGAVCCVDKVSELARVLHVSV